MKHKVGDVVRIRSDLNRGKEYDGNIVVDDMMKYRGMATIITNANSVRYFLECDPHNYYWTDAMLEENSHLDTNKIFDHEETPKTKPKYYKTESGRDILDVIKEFNLDFFQGNVYKYVYRYKNKNGIEDLKKAKEYIDRMIQIEEQKCKSSK